MAGTYHGEGDVEKKSGPFAGKDDTFPVGTPKDLADAKTVCNNPSVSGKHPGTCEKVDHMSKPAHKKKALTAEPGFIFTKSPTTVRNEFANRITGGIHPDEVFKQILGEISDHYQTGQINNRDAHRAANEAFGRLLFARKQAQETRKSTNPDNTEDKPRKNFVPGDDPVRYYHPHMDSNFVSEKKGSRKQAWQGWGRLKQPKVAGWKWDQHLSAYIAEPGTSQFTCKCGANFDVPSYHSCGDCGTTFNAYVIGVGGDKHQAAVDKMLCREIPARKEGDVIVAKRKRAGNGGWTEDAHGARNDLPGGHRLDVWYPDPQVRKSPKIIGESEGGLPAFDPDPEPWAHGRTQYDWRHTGKGLGVIGKGSADSLEEGMRAAEQSHRNMTEWNPDTDPFDPREFGANLKRRAYSDYDKWTSDADHQIENENPFPSDHHPKTNTTSKGSGAKDWHRRDHGTQRWVQ